MLLGGAAGTVTPMIAVAQQQAGLPVIGFVNGASALPFASRIAAFREGLREVGFIENENVTIEFRWAEGQYDRLPGLVNDVIARGASVIVATGGTHVARVAKRATSNIPIVFTVGADPIQAGLVSSIPHPGGNITGVSLLTSDLVKKRVEMLLEMVPTVTAIALLTNPNSAIADSEVREAEVVARGHGLQIQVLHASSATEIDAALATLSRDRVGALLVGGDAFLESRRDQLVTLVAREVLPAIFDTRSYVEAGGLASYGTDYGIGYREVGAYAGRILHGAKPGDLPVLQLSKIELVVSLKTAKALGIAIPQSILARADEVVE